MTRGGAMTPGKIARDVEGMGKLLASVGAKIEGLISAVLRPAWIPN